MKSKRKPKIKYNPSYIARVIKDRKFHNIPQWLMKMVNLNVFNELLEFMGRTIDEEYSKTSKTTVGQSYLDCIEFIQDSISTLSIEEVADYISTHYDRNSVVARVVPYLVTKDADWVYVLSLLRKWLSTMSRDDSIILLFEYRQAQYISTNETSWALTDIIMKIQSDYIEQIDGAENVQRFIKVDDGRRGNVHSLVCKLKGRAVRDFYHKSVVFGASLATIKYPLLRPKYEFGNIWQTVPQFYPDNIKDYMVVVSYLYMVANSEYAVNMSDNIMPIFERVMFEHRGNRTEILTDILELIAKATAKDVNNVRFLSPFKVIREDYTENDDFVNMRIISSALKDTIKAVCDDSSQHLIDFKYLYDNYNSPIILSNTNLQRAFIFHGGMASTLMKSYLGTDVNSFIYTADGLEFAIRNSNTEDLPKLLEDEELIDIIEKDIIGRVYYYNVISYIVQAILNMKEIPDRLVSILEQIDAAYPISHGDADAYRMRISNIDPLEMKSLDYNVAVSNIPVSHQAYMKLVSHVVAKKEYVPLWYGINKKPDIDRLLPIELIDELVNVSPGYIGDISSEVIGKTMLIRHSS